MCMDICYHGSRAKEKLVVLTMVSQLNLFTNFLGTKTISLTNESYKQSMEGSKISNTQSEEYVYKGELDQFG